MLSLLKVALALLLATFLSAKEFTLASYNVQNLFDLHLDHTEYKDYIPNSYSKWNKKHFQIKLKNLSKVIIDLDADIIALQEIENKNALQALQKLTNYPYYAITNSPSSAINLAILSRYKIQNHKEIPVQIKYKRKRGILRVKVNLDGHSLYIYNNHWPSKRNPESNRIAYAKALKKDIAKIRTEYIIMGDLNSYYNEHKRIKRQRKINDTDGISALNHILPTSYAQKKKRILINEKNWAKDKNALYNVWLEFKKEERYNYQYRKKNITLDHILLPYSLGDKKKIDYQDNSFFVFKPPYLFAGDKINRWQKYSIYKKGKREYLHLGKGYSDHLPIGVKLITY